MYQSIGGHSAFIIHSDPIQVSSTHAYLLILAHPLADPFLGLCEVGLHFDEAQFPAPFDQLIGLRHQFLEKV